MLLPGASTAVTGLVPVPWGELSHVPAPRVVAWLSWLALSIPQSHSRRDLSTWSIL